MNCCFKLTGLLYIRKLPVLNTWVYPDRTEDLAFKLKKKGLLIEVNILLAFKNLVFFYLVYKRVNINVCVILIIFLYYNSFIFFVIFSYFDSTKSLIFSSRSDTTFLIINVTNVLL